MKKLYLLAIALCVLNGVYSSVKLSTDTIHKQITDFQSDSLIKTKTTAELYILDVRTPTEFSTGHLINANNIDYRATGFWDKVDILDRNLIYVVHCKGGSRSLPVYNQMISMHFREVYMMIGGFDQWKSDGLPYVTDMIADNEKITVWKQNNIIYNNSAGSELLIEIKAPVDKTTLSVINTNGQELIKIQKPESRLTLDISSLVQGVYFIKLQNGNNLEIRKFLKK